MTILQDQILNESELMERLDIGQRSKLREALDAMLIPYKLLPSGKLFTTLSSINMRLHGYGKDQESQQIDDDFA